MGAKAKITRGKMSGRVKPRKPAAAKSTNKASKPAKKAAAKPTKAKAAKPTKVAAANKAPAGKPATKVAAAKPAKKAPAAKPAKKAPAAKHVASVATPAAAMPDAFAPSLDDSAVDIAGDADVAKKPGALARLGRGVGSLFAKVTGRGKKKATDDDVPNETTIEIVTEDIVATRPAGTKPPPPPGVDD